MEVEVGPLGAEMDDAIVDWFRQLLEEEDAERFTYRMDELTSEQTLESNPGLVRRLVDVVAEIKPDEVFSKMARMRLLMHDKLEEDAIELALEVYFLPELQDEEDWQYYQARYYITETMLPLAPRRFLKKLEEQQHGKTPDLTSVTRRLDLVSSLEDQDLFLQELRKAKQLLPDELSILRKLHTALNATGLTTEADTLLAEMIEQFPDDADLAQLEYRTWTNRSHPLKALAAFKRLREIEGSGKASEQAEEGEEKLANADIGAVKKAIEEEDFTTASTLLRRMWRTYPSENQRYYFGPNNSWTTITWPADYKKDEELTAEELSQRKAEQARFARAGLDAYMEPDKDAEKQPNAWEVLAHYPFGVAEMQRFLRSNGPKNLEEYTAIIDGLAIARTLEDGPDQAVAELLQKVNSGEAIKVEILQLLSLLQNNPESVGPEAQQALDELTGSLHPRDGNQLLRLANVMVAAGARDRALDLYRWCATQTSSSSYFSFREEDFGSIEVGRLVSEMRESLVEGDDMIGIIEQALEFSTPSDNPWEQASYQRLVLDTWIGLLEPGQALQRCRDICASADAKSEYNWNNFSDTAAWLYAHQNELDRAIECLDFYLGLSRWQSIRQSDYPRFFPEDGSSWVDYRAWLNRIGPAMLQWIHEDKLQDGDGMRAVALVVVRLFEQDDLPHAQELLDKLAALPFDTSNTSLWIADAARRIGDNDLALQIERDLFDKQLLNVWRLTELLERMATEEGPDRVLAYGESMISQRQPMRVMELMERIATEAGDSDASALWAQRIARAKQAQDEIDELRGVKDKKKSDGAMQMIRIR
jgi:hypothetical protein